MKRPPTRDPAVVDAGLHRPRRGHRDRHRRPHRVPLSGRSGDDPILRSGHRPHRDLQRPGGEIVAEVAGRPAPAGAPAATG
jgi:hypothetical protein